jgi:predicted permease
MSQIWKTSRACFQRLGGLFHKAQRDAEFAAELESHLQLHVEDNLRAGMTPEAARRDALIRLGGLDQAKELYRDRRSLALLETTLQDCRYALRLLRKNPGFTLVAIATLALGIGANTAMFSVMNTVLLRALPVPHPEQLVYLKLPNWQPAEAFSTGDSETSFSEPVFEQLRKEQGVFQDLMAYAPLAANRVAVRISEDPEEAEADEVSGNFFSGLGVALARGRGFSPGDEASHAPLAVLSYAYWTRRFGRSPSAIGQSFYVKGVPFTVIGVAAPDFYGLDPGSSTDFWIPLQNRAELNPWGQPASQLTLYGTPKWWCIRLIGRLAARVTEAQALAQLDPAFQGAAMIGLGTPVPKNRKPVLAMAAAKGIEGARDRYERPIGILMVMVGLVLLIACANVAMLLVARNSAREREFSLRMALGAGGSRLLRQLLTESLLLVAAGALLGWGFAVSASRSLAAWSGLAIPFSPDSTVLLFALAISVACAVVFGLVPFGGAASVPSGFGIKTSHASACRDKKTSWSGKAIVAVQIALCFTLLIGAGLLVRSLRNYETLPLGLRTDGLLVFGTSPLKTRNDEEKVRFYQTLLERLRVVPGVESVTLLENRLGSGWSTNAEFAIDGVKPEGDFLQIGVRTNDVGPDYLHVLGIPLLRGRDLRDADGRTAPKVAVVNQTFVDRLLPKGDPLGHRIGGSKPESTYTIVGVAADSKYTRVGEKPTAMAYFPYCQSNSVSDMQVELHTMGDPEALIPSAGAVLRQLDPNLPMQQPMTQRAQFDESFSQARLFGRLSIFFGLTASLLVATGLYGTMAYRVSRRTSEIGVRMALGAERSQILWMVLRESLLISAVGIVVGTPLGFVGARVMRSMLFGLGPTDAVSLVAALVGVILVAGVAGLIPARRAAAVDPMTALRCE